MKVALAAAVPSLAFLVAIALIVVNSRRERETMLKAVNLAITEGTKERDAARKERQELANRIQRPESTPIYDVSDEPQDLPFDDDGAYWKYQEARANGGSE